MTEMSLKKIMQKVHTEKAKRGTNVLGESRPLGSLQRSILSTRAFRAQSREQLLSEGAENDEGLDEKRRGPTTRQQSRKNKRQRAKRSGKPKKMKHVKAAMKGLRGVPASKISRRSKVGWKTRRRNEGAIMEENDTSVDQLAEDFLTYHESLAAMTNEERNAFFEEVNEAGLYEYFNVIEDAFQLEAKCSEEEDEEEDEEDDDKDDEDEMEEKSSKKESTKGTDEDPIEEMLVGSDEHSQVDKHEENPLDVGQKTSDPSSGQKVVGQDPAPNATGKVKNAKGDSPEYKDQNHTPSAGTDRNQRRGYGY